MVGSVRVESLAHASESALLEIRDGRLKPERGLIEALLFATDLMRDAAARDPRGEMTAPEKDLVHRLLSMSGDRESETRKAFPELDPEVLEVLSEAQMSQLLNARALGGKVW